MMATQRAAGISESTLMSDERHRAYLRGGDVVLSESVDMFATQLSSPKAPASDFLLLH